VSTAPFLSDSEVVTAETHQQVVRATATHPDFEGPVELALTDIDLNWDSGRAPRVTATLTCAVPDPSVLEQLDPRTGVRVEIECGYVRPGGIEDVNAVGDLGLRRVRVNRPGNTLTLECASDEMLVIDGSPAASASVTDTTHAGAIKKLVNQTIYPNPVFSTAVSGGSVTVDPVVDRWDSISDIADRINAQVYDDGLRKWYVAPTPVVSATPDATLVVGENGTVLESDSELDRDNWFNYVYLRYRWTDSGGVDHEVGATAVVNSGPYAVSGPAGKRILIQEREIPTTQAEANAAAKSVLLRALSRGYAHRVTAIAAYWLRPGMTASLTLPGREPESHIVQRVGFNPVRGTMSVETRLPDIPSDDDLTTTTPPSAPVDPDPAPPVTQKYVSEWVASSSRSYKGDGTENSFIAPDMAQGYYSSSNGNQCAIALFTSANSTGDETSKTVTQALTGATVSKVEVWLYANHWFSFSGGIGRIGFYNGTSLPSTFSGPSPYVTVKDWKDNSGRWVTITSPSLISALTSGSCRGITVGKGVGTDQTYYGKFNGASASSNKPKLRITYAK
jgi:hypothetical protein